MVMATHNIEAASAQRDLEDSVRVEVLVTGRDEPMHLPGVEGFGQQLLHRRNFGQSQQVNVEQKIWKKRQQVKLL